VIVKYINPHDYTFAYTQNPNTEREKHSKDDYKITKDFSSVLLKTVLHRTHQCRSQWRRGLRRRSSAARLLRLWVRIPTGAWMFVCCECCVLSGRGLCDGLITRPEESHDVAPKLNIQHNLNLQSHNTTNNKEWNQPLTPNYFIQCWTPHETAHNLYYWRWAYRWPKHVEIFMIINHNCCIELVNLVSFKTTYHYVI